MISGYLLLLHGLKGPFQLTGTLKEPAGTCKIMSPARDQQP